MNIALGVDPTRRMSQHVELAGIIGDDDEFLVQSVVMEAGDEGAFGGDAPMADVGDVECLKLSEPSGVVVEEFRPSAQ